MRQYRLHPPMSAPRPMKRTRNQILCERIGSLSRNHLLIEPVELAPSGLTAAHL